MTRRVVVRGQAIRSLALGDTAQAQAEAVRLITTDPSFFVQEAALSVYDPAIAPQGTALLIDRSAHGGSLGVRLAAAQRLARRPDAAGLDALEAMTAEKEPREVRTRCAHASRAVARQDASGGGRDTLSQ